MYISRYAVTSWGPYYFQAAKHYSLTEANLLVSINAICGILGTASSGFVSDKWFGGHRNKTCSYLWLDECYRSIVDALCSAKLAN